MSSLWPWSSCYFPPLGVTMLASSDGTVRVYNGQTGFLDKETNLVTSSVDNCSRISLGYFPSNERLVITRETEINARTHSNGSVLLHGFLDKRIQNKTDKISLEFYSNQGSVIELFLSTVESLYTDYGSLVINTHNCPNPKL
ncbi:Baculoviral IAP repeat-containing protein 6 [Schistosoma haematobium]|uniref:Baculoviral IAP repeat-containing protein 6 n=1 Tax=Schistosoma haematobium TaxID=6185 RepID=A0A922S4R3_SCHHA|nr:Baculoviral IAP repeat-containing protein 6 [Schistosoma haematobium]KAH9593809.1 Baculoviral IAP repeat-containing protein 6 [Schistosoma haematobium]